MKRYQILLFIISSILALGLLCYFFPKDGVKVGPFTLGFASLEQVWGKEEVEEEPEISPEELLAMRQKALEIEEQKDSIETFFKNSPTRFHFPNDDLTFFDKVFEAMEGADSTKVRVVHYGDSQIEEDRISFVIRDTLQKMFGGDGQGMMPGRQRYTFSMSGSSSAALTRYMIFSNRAGGNKYGPYADFVRLYGSTRLTYLPSSSKNARIRRFNEVTVLAGNVKGNGLSIRCQDSTMKFDAGQNYVRAVFQVPDSSERVSVNLSGTADIYGVLMDNRTGVAVDNVPMRGCSGTIFTAMNADQLRQFYSDENVKLIFMQFGGNSVPVIRNSEQVSKFCGRVKKQIEFIQGLAPDARIVYIGPSDMAKTIRGVRQTYPILPELIDSLKSTATSTGAAYWDIFSAMGGKGSMVAWVRARPSLAATDYIHFTRKGAILMGEMFAESFKMYYEYYVWRRKNEE